MSRRRLGALGTTTNITAAAVDVRVLATLKVGLEKEGIYVKSMSELIRKVMDIAAIGMIAKGIKIAKLNDAQEVLNNWSDKPLWFGSK